MGTAQEYDIETRQGFSVITFQACLAECKWGDIERVGTEIKQLLASGAKPFCLLDLSRLEFMGSSIVALLVRVWKAIQEQQGSMVVVNPNSMTKEVLEIAGLSKVWTICNSRPEAEAELKKFLPADSQTSGILAAIVGWICLGLTLSVVIAQKKSLLALDANVLLALSYGGVILGLLLCLLAVVLGRGAWRFFGTAGIVVSACLIGAIATGTI